MSCAAALIARICRNANPPMVAMPTNRNATIAKSLALMESLASIGQFQMEVAEHRAVGDVPKLDLNICPLF